MILGMLCRRQGFHWIVPCIFRFPLREKCVTGLSDEDNEKVKKLVKDRFMQQIKNSYLSHSQTVENMSDEEYRLSGYVEELDRFLNKVSNGNVTADDL